jgi:hypothetical protein
MRQLLLSIHPFQENRLHQATAFGCPIARLHIHVPTKEALRAMIGVPIPCYRLPALAAREILDLSLE